MDYFKYSNASKVSSLTMIIFNLEISEKEKREKIRAPSRKKESVAQMKHEVQHLSFSNSFVLIRKHRLKYESFILGIHQSIDMAWRVQHWQRVEHRLSHNKI